MTAKPFDTLACSGKKLIKRIFKEQPQHADKNAACGEDGQNESAKKDAEEPAAKGNSSGVSQEIQNTHTELKKDIHDARAQVQDLRAELKNDMQTLRTEVQNTHAELKNDIQTLRTEVQNTHAELKNDIQTLRAELESVKAAIKETETRLGTCRLCTIFACLAALAALAVVLAKGFMGF